MNTTIDQNNPVSTNDAIKIIKAIIKTQIAHPETAHKFGAIILKGAPGVGKSTIVKTIANDLKIGFIDVRLAMMERCDLAGLPSVENGVTKWNIPAFWPHDGAGILFFDEITAAPSDAQVAAYQLILDRALTSAAYKLPPGWAIVAAGNRKQDKAVAKTMSSALANRFTHLTIEANAEEWGEWAVAHDIHPSVTGYIRYRPANLFVMENQNLEAGWPSPRSWERVSNMIQLFSGDENFETLRKVVYGAIGPAVGVEFMEFHKIQARFDDVLEMLTNPDAKITIPDEADKKWALCSAISYLLWNGKDEDEHKTRIEGMYRIIMKMTSDFATMVAKLAMIGNSKIDRFKASMMIMSSPSYKKFAEKFGSEFAEHHTLN